ncbi:MAG: hypothetical protein MI725_09610, partial [Pirellulales bacterium]|nr:hypothetical protein [Pirellulales bacterium]
MGPATVCPGGCFLCYAAPPILIYLRTPADNQRGPQHAEHLLADLMQANTRRLAVSLLYTSALGETVLALDVASPLLTPATRAILAHYPGVGVTGVSLPDKDGSATHSIYLRLVPDTRSLRTAADFEDQLQRLLAEPTSGLIEAVTDRRDGLHASIIFSLESASPRRRRRAQRVAAIAAGKIGRWFPALVDGLAMRANGTLWERITVWPFRFSVAGDAPPDAERKLDDHLWCVTIQLQVVSPHEKSRLAQKRLATLAAAFAPFTAPGSVSFQTSKKRVRSLLSAAELAALWHPPVGESPRAAMQPVALPHLPPPVELLEDSSEEGRLPL